MGDTVALEECKMGAPKKIGFCESPELSISVQVMEECASIDLSDGNSKCTTDGAIATGIRLLQQWQAQIEQGNKGLCELKFDTTESIEKYFFSEDGTMWQSGESTKSVGGLRIKVLHEDALKEVIGEEVYSSVVDENGYVLPDEVCFVVRETIEGNELKAEHDKVMTNGYGYGRVCARLWKSPDVVLAVFVCALGVGCIDDNGMYKGKACTKGKELKDRHPELISIIAEHPELISIIAEHPELISIIAEWPSVVNSLVETGRRNYAMSVDNAIINTGFIPNVNSGLEIDFRLTETDNNTASVISYVDKSSGVNAFGLGVWDKRWVFNYGNYTLTGTVEKDVMYHYAQQKGNISIVGSNGYVERLTKTGSFTNSNPLPMFTNNRNGTFGPGMSSVQIFRFKIFDDEVLVHDFIPFRRNGKFGMYDIITDTFCGNARSEGYIACFTESK